MAQDGARDTHHRQREVCGRGNLVPIASHPEWAQTVLKNGADFAAFEYRLHPFELRWENKDKQLTQFPRGLRSMSACLAVLGPQERPSFSYRADLELRDCPVATYVKKQD